MAERTCELFRPYTFQREVRVSEANRSIFWDGMVDRDAVSTQIMTSGAPSISLIYFAVVTVQGIPQERQGQQGNVLA